MRTAALALAMTLAAPAAALAQPPAAAQSHAQHHALGTLLSISAEETVTVAPDKAVITLGVQSEAATAQAASQANAQAMNTVMGALRRARIAERDIQTAGLSLNPQYRYEENTAPKVIGYQAANTVQVTVRELANLGRVLDAAVAAGGNTVQGVSFDIENRDAALDRARRGAVTKATARARLYAEATGLKVGRIVQISEGGGFAPPPMPMLQARMAMVEAAPTPVSPGELALTANVSIVFELEQ